MNSYTFKYLVREGFQNVARGKKTTVASLVITCITMIIFGIFFIATTNLEQTSKDITSKQGMEVFLNDISEEDTKRVENEIRSIQGITDVSYKNKDEAFEQAKQILIEQKTVLEGYEDENKKIFPASFTVILSQEALDNSNDIMDRLTKIEGVDSVEIKEEVIQAASSIGKAAKIVTIVILTFSVISSILLISNTIKISVYSRRKEISIMKYVGATNDFIRTPFLVQGATTGVISAGISSAIMAICYKLILIKSSGNAVFSLLTTISFSDMLRTLVAIFMALGISIGIIGSYISMKKYLQV